ncbi:MAG: chemotaxis protein CheW [Planctomycetes bacterium]|nr:chemotaxis protein CheW [Planctomycetota bacterium]
MSTASYRAGIPVGSVREVLIRRRIVRVPDAAFPVLGLLSLRGEMVTAFDLAGLEARAGGAGEAAPGTETTGVTTGAIRPSRVEAVVVLRGGRDGVGLVVDGVEDIRDFAPGRGGAGAGEPAGPAVGAPAPGRLWAGTVRDARGEIGVLDVEAAVEAALAVTREDPPGQGRPISPDPQAVFAGPDSQGARAGGGGPGGPGRVE